MGFLNTIVETIRVKLDQAEEDITDLKVVWKEDHKQIEALLTAVDIINKQLIALEKK